MDAYQQARLHSRLDILLAKCEGDPRKIDSHLTPAEQSELNQVCTQLGEEEEREEAARRRRSGLAEFYGPETTWDVHGRL